MNAVATLWPMASLAEQIGARLRLARDEAGLSREQAASRLGLSIAAIQHHENGFRELRPEIALRYSKLYKISLDWLYSGQGIDPDQVELLRDYRRSPPEGRVAIRQTARALSVTPEEKPK